MAQITWFHPSSYEAYKASLRLQHPVIEVTHSPDEWQFADGTITPALRVLLNLRATLRPCRQCLAVEAFKSSLSLDRLEARSTLCA